jgi:hypothetical protein
MAFGATRFHPYLPTKEFAVNTIRVSALAIAVLSLLVLSGCGGKPNPRLIYQTATEPADSCSVSFTVVEFDLKGDDSQVGETSDGEGIYTDNDISLWVTDALKNELAHNQCMALVHDREYYPISDYVILGSVDKLWVRQESMTEYEAVLTLTMTMKKGDKDVFTETVTTSLQRTVVPGRSVVRTLLEEVLQDAMRDMVPKILARSDAL